MSIINKVQELQREMRERFGVDAQIEIMIYRVRNSQLNKETANHIILEIASEMNQEDIERYVNDSTEDFWYVILRGKNMEVVGYYD